MKKANAPVTEVVVQKSMNPLLKKVLIWTLVVILLLGSVGILTVSAFEKKGTLIRRADGIIIDGVTLKASEVDFYYNLYEMSLYSTTYNYYTTYGIDPYGIDFNKSLFKQAYTTDSDNSGAPDYETWGDYVLEQAVGVLYNYVILNNEAEAAGFLQMEGVEEQIQRGVELTIADTKAEAEANGASYLAYLRYYYGNTVTEESYEAAVRRECIANYYSTEIYKDIEVAEWEVSDEYADNKVDYDTVDFLNFSVTVKLDEHLNENGEKYSDDATKEADDKKITEAILKLRTELDAVTNEIDFRNLAKQYNATESDAADKDYAPLSSHVAYSSLEDADATLLFADTTEAGKTYINRDENVLKVFYFVSRNDNHYNAREFRHILLTAEKEDEAVLAQAQDILNQWNSGAKTAESFGELAFKYTEDVASMREGGLVEDIGVGAVVTEINDWLFAEDRVEGDTEIIYSSYGYHIVYFEGESDAEYWEILCEDSLRSAKYETLVNEMVSKHSYKTLDGLDRIR
ncbi:MAG: peptidylprolyl isomerase [Clostridia bacterium]|nr:peptidylprolyl isomerase [Clostridia bacterium]